MEPKSGKLHKLGSGLFGPKWTEKWVHLDGTLLKCFPMAVQQQVFSLGSSRQSSTYDLIDYKFALADEKKLNRKFTFQLESVQKSSKAVTFACSSEKELVEWRLALQSQLCSPANASISPVIAEKIRRAAEAYSKIDTRNTGQIDSGKLRGLLQTIGWDAKESESRLIQLQLDLGHQRIITRTRFLSWLQNFYCAQEEMARVEMKHNNNQNAVTCGNAPEQPEDRTLDSSSARVSASKCLVYQKKEDWEQRYKALQRKEDPADIFTVGLEMAAFLAEFRKTAELLVMEIVLEMAFEEAEKTLRPQPLDGDDFFATDRVQHSRSLLPILKYQCDGLLVYLCSNHTSSGKYEERVQNAERVAVFHKLVGHQIRGARAVKKAIEEIDDNSQSNRQDRILQVPLQCTVDHLGFRAFVIASPLPVLISTRGNLINQVKINHLQQLHHELKLVFDYLGLLTDSLHAQDDVQNIIPNESLVPAYFPISAGFTVEAREGELALKLQNLLDVFPSDVSIDEPDAIALEAVLYKMRPEFVRMHGNSLPLYSNTHLTVDQQEQCATSKSQVEMQLLQQSARFAHECLQTIIIPQFVADLENGAVQVTDSGSLTRALHGEGICVRYLASCYELVSLKHIRRALLAEMVARACKVEFRASLRALLQESSLAISGQISDVSSLDEGYRNVDFATARTLARMTLLEKASHVTVEFFNLVLGISSLDSKLFWEERILPQLISKFGIPGGELTWDIIVSEELLHMPQLFHALQVQTGVCYIDHISYNFKCATPLSCEYIQSIYPRTKLLARSTAACEKVMESSDAFLAAKELNSALSSIIFHISILETAPSDERNLSLCHLLTCAANILLALNLLDEAEQVAVLAIEESPNNHAELARVYTVLMKLKYASSDLVGAQNCFAKALELIQWHLGPLHPLLCDSYMTMTDILSDLGNFEQAVETMQNCVDLVRDSFGKASLLYADIRRQQGMLMLAANPTDGEAIIGILEDAFSVYEKHFHDIVENVKIYKEFAAECCYVLATLQIQVNGSQAAETAYGIALTGLGLRKEVLSSSHEDMMKSYLQLGSLSRDLGEYYRAVDHFKPALSIMKMIHDDKHIDQIPSITQLMLQLHLKTLSLEKRNIVDKTAKRFAQLWPRFMALSEHIYVNDAGEESALLTFVMKNLFRLEPIEYANLLIEKTDLELQDYRKQYNFNFASTLHRNNAGESSPKHALLRSSSGRFSSFSGDGTFSPPGSPRAPISPMRHPSLFPSSPRGRTSFNQLDCNFLRHSTGDFSFGGQLVAILFLVDHPVADSTTLHKSSA